MAADLQTPFNELTKAMEAGSTSDLGHRARLLVRIREAFLALSADRSTRKAAEALQGPLVKMLVDLLGHHEHTGPVFHRHVAASLVMIVRGNITQTLSSTRLCVNTLTTLGKTAQSAAEAVGYAQWE